MKPMLITHPDCLEHKLKGHPERPERLSSVLTRFESSGVTQDMQQILATEISDTQLRLTHPASYIKHIEATAPTTGISNLDPDTYMSPGSLRASKLAAGALAQATHAILNKETTRAFCAIRPPGHHAELAEAFGFCLFNNIAIAAQIALQDPSIKRVAILDFDVHHCNGTVDIFKDNEAVLVCSSFQDHFFPYRYLDYDNPHIISTRLTSGTDGKTYRHLIEAQWLPALQRHKPDIIFVSAGFDAHRDDPLGEICLLESDFEWITDLIIDQANSHSEGRIISTLEGGYNLEALASSATCHLQRLLD